MRRMQESSAPPSSIGGRGMLKRLGKFLLQRIGGHRLSSVTSMGTNQLELHIPTVTSPSPLENCRSNAHSKIGVKLQFTPSCLGCHRLKFNRGRGRERGTLVEPAMKKSEGTDTLLKDASGLSNTPSANLDSQAAIDECSAAVGDLAQGSIEEFINAEREKQRELQLADPTTEVELQEATLVEPAMKKSEGTDTPLKDASGLSNTPSANLDSQAAIDGCSASVGDLAQGSIEEFINAEREKQREVQLADPTTEVELQEGTLVEPAMKKSEGTDTPLKDASGLSNTPSANLDSQAAIDGCSASVGDLAQGSIEEFINAEREKQREVQLADPTTEVELQEGTFVEPAMKNSEGTDTPLKDATGQSNTPSANLDSQAAIDECSAAVGDLAQCSIEEFITAEREKQRELQLADPTTEVELQEGTLVEPATKKTEGTDTPLKDASGLSNTQAAIDECSAAVGDLSQGSIEEFINAEREKQRELQLADPTTEVELQEGTLVEPAMKKTEGTDTPLKDASGLSNTPSANLDSQAAIDECSAAVGDLAQCSIEEFINAEREKQRELQLADPTTEVELQEEQLKCKDIEIKNLEQQLAKSRLELEERERNLETLLKGRDVLIEVNQALAKELDELKHCIERQGEELKKEKDDNRKEKERRQTWENKLLYYTKNVEKWETKISSDLDRYKHAVNWISDELEKLKQHKGNFFEGTPVVKVFDDHGSYISAVKSFKRVVSSIFSELGTNAGQAVMPKASLGSVAGETRASTSLAAEPDVPKDRAIAGQAVMPKASLGSVAGETRASTSLAAEPDFEKWAEAEERKRQENKGSERSEEREAKPVVRENRNPAVGDRSEVHRKGPPPPRNDDGGVRVREDNNGGYRGGGYGGYRGGNQKEIEGQGRIFRTLARPVARENRNPNVGDSSELLRRQGAPCNDGREDNNGGYRGGNQKEIEGQGRIFRTLARPVVRENRNPNVGDSSELLRRQGAPHNDGREDNYGGYRGGNYYRGGGQVNWRKGGGGGYG